MSHLLYLIFLATIATWVAVLASWGVGVVAVVVQASSEPQQQLVVACQVILATWRRRARVRSTLVCSLLPHARGRLARAVAFSGRVTRSRPGLKAVTRAGQLTRLRTNVRPYLRVRAKWRRASTAVEMRC